MANSEELIRALRSFAAAMRSNFDTVEMSYQLADHVVAALGAIGAGVSVTDPDGALRFVTATTQTIVEIERVQEAAQEGPCYMAFETQQPMMVPDISQLEKWPQYTQAAANLGLNTVLGFPLGYDGQKLGALNIYGVEARDWVDDDLDVLGVFADMTVAYLLRQSEIDEQKQLASQLQGALDSRVIIEQAKGIVAGTHGVSLDEAFAKLRQHARSNNIKLAELCAGVINSGMRVPQD